MAGLGYLTQPNPSKSYDFLETQLKFKANLAAPPRSLATFWGYVNLSFPSCFVIFLNQRGL